MINIQKNRTKYTGLPLSSLIFMVKTKAPVDKILQREVWKELFFRYFSEGRTFNLYKLLEKQPEMFANTIAWELSADKVEMPIAHSEYFMRNLLTFIDYVDKRVLKSGNMEFEWQLHEMQGLKAMLERVRDAKITDYSLRQKINLFIDKINLKRKESLIAIENKEKIDTNDSAVSHEIVATHKKELMQQELKHLSIPVSKMNREKWEEAIWDIDLYYPKDQEKLLKQGLKKYPSFHEAKSVSLRAFQLNLRLKIPNVSMIGLLLNGIGYGKEVRSVFGSPIELYNSIKEWYLSCHGTTDEGWQELSVRILNELSGDSTCNNLLTEIQLNSMREFYPYVKQFTGKKLSEVLSWDISHLNTTRVKRFNVNLEYSTANEGWVAKESFEKSEASSIFERFYQIFDDVRGKSFRNGKYSHQLFRYDVNYSRKKDLKLEILEIVSKKDCEMIQSYCDFPVSLIIDYDTVPLLNKPSVISMIPTGFGDSLGGNRSYFLDFFKHKHMFRAISVQELKFLYKTEEGRKLFHSFSKFPMNGSGAFRERIDFLAEYFNEILELFNFQDDLDRNYFFSLDFKPEDFFLKYKSLTLEQAELVTNKLKEEAPHEYALVSEYFYGINETYEEFKSYAEFDYLSSFERLILEKEGVNTGEQFKHEGYKESYYGSDIYYSSEQAIQKFVIEFMKNHYANNESF